MKEEERKMSRMKVVQIDNIKAMIGRRTNRIKNERIRDLFGVRKEVDEVRYESSKRWIHSVREILGETGSR